MSNAPKNHFKLQFRRTESLFLYEIKQAEEELEDFSSEIKHNDDIVEILRNFESKFKLSEFRAKCESYLSEMEAISNELVAMSVENKVDICHSLREKWMSLVKRISEMNEKIEQLFQSKEKLEADLKAFSKWLIEFDESYMHLFSKNMSSSSEYDQLIESLKVSC